MIERQPKNFPDSRLAKIDAKLCGESLLPASKYWDLSEDDKGAKRIARGRQAIRVSAFAEAFGRASVTHGLETGDSKFIILGTLAAVTGGMLQTSIKNRLGARWSLLLTERIERLGGHKRAITETLNNKGISAEEVSQLNALPTTTYNNEFKDPELEKIKNILFPVSNGIALGIDGNGLPAAALIAAGLLTVPTGDMVFRSFSERAAQKRLGISALHFPFLREVFYKAHLRMTDKINFGSYFTDGLIAALALTDAKGYGSTIYAAMTGSKGYLNILYTQKDREEAVRSTEIADDLIKALSREPFIVTPQAWKRHTERHGVNLFKKGKPPFSEGLIIKDFLAKKPSGQETSLAPLNLELPKGGAAILRAKSGGGKSTTLMALMHLYEHEGDVHFVKDNKFEDVHSSSGPEAIAEEFLLITEDQLAENASIVDLFKPYFKESAKELYESHMKKYKGKDRMYMEVAWMGADNLLEKEIEKLQERRKSVFPRSMRKDLEELRKKRNEWVNKLIQDRGGNISSVEAKSRTFKTLSDGEKRSMMALVAKAGAMVKKRTLIILDEPLAGLDAAEKRRQIAELRKIQDETGASIIVVSHDNIDELQEGLNDCQVIELTKKEPLALTTRGTEFTPPDSSLLRLPVPSVKEENLNSPVIKNVVRELLTVSNAYADPTDKDARRMVGLHATQLGFGENVMLALWNAYPNAHMRDEGWQPEFKVLINPEIVDRSEAMNEDDSEGCFSVKQGVGGVASRHDRVKVKALEVDLNEFLESGEVVTQEVIHTTPNKYVSRVLQHEIDHGLGMRFPYHTDMQEGSLYEITDAEAFKNHRNQEALRIIAGESPDRRNPPGTQPLTEEFYQREIAIPLRV